MDSLILKSLDEHINGLSFSGLVCNLLQKGYQTTASSEDFKKMVKSRISCLKKKRTDLARSCVLNFFIKLKIEI